MHHSQARLPGADKVEVRLFFRRFDDQPVVERIYLHKDSQQSALFECILWVWGNSPDSDELAFFMAQDNVSRVVVTKPGLLLYIDANKHLYGP